MRGKAPSHKTEMNQLLRDIEPIFQQVVKIDPFDVHAHRELASVEMFAKYMLFSCIKLLFIFVLNAKRMKN